MSAVDFAKLAPHQARRIGGKVLLANAAGSHEVVTEEEYRAFLAGVKPGDALFERLAPKGFLREHLDFDALARAEGERGLFAWQGPPRHVIYVDGSEPEVLCAQLDFLFAIPRGDFDLEAVSAAPDDWKANLWFLRQYAQCKAEWTGKTVSLTLRTPGGEAAEGFAARAELEAKRGPEPLPKAERFLIRAGARAADAAGWAAALKAAGAKSFRWDGGKPELWIEVVRAAQDAGLVEECAREAEAGRLDGFEGLDLLNELAYGPDGGIFSSEAGLRLEFDDDALFRLGEAAHLRWSDLAEDPFVQVLLAAAEPEHNPACRSCVYRTRCRPAPSALHAEQRTLWGRMTESRLCAQRMRRLDLWVESGLAMKNP